MIGRYVLATAAVVLLVVGLLLGAVVYLGLHYGEAADSRVRIGTLAEALIPTADGLQLDPARTPADWLQGYAWAMVLDDDGSVIWQHDLPQNLNKHYTASEIASFSRWYLDDWPVFCWTADYGLFVAAMPRGSVWRCNIYNNAQLMNAMAAGMLPALALLLLAFPLFVNLPAYSTLSAEQTSMPYVLLDALLIVLLQAAFESSVDERHLAYRAGTVMLGVSLLGTTIFANQVYLKKTLEFDSTLSVMTRVIARAEAVPAFKPGETPVALVGSIEDSELSVVHEGFEKLDALDAAANNFAATDDTGNVWYTWEVLGYPFSLVDAYTLGQLEQRDDVQAMPAFPAQDCCQMIDGTLVVKLSAI